MVLFFVILALVFVLVLVIVSNIVIVPQSKVYVIERLGSYSDTWTAGLHVKIPFIERIAKKVSLKEQVADFPPQPVITRDNVTMQIDTVVFFQVMDAKLYTYGVNQPIAAIESLSATTLRNIIGEMELDHPLIQGKHITVYRIFPKIQKCVIIHTHLQGQGRLNTAKLLLPHIIGPSQVSRRIRKSRVIDDTGRCPIDLYDPVAHIRILLHFGEPFLLSFQCKLRIGIHIPGDLRIHAPAHDLFQIFFGDLS